MHNDTYKALKVSDFSFFPGNEIIELDNPEFCQSLLDKKLTLNNLLKISHENNRNAIRKFFTTTQWANNTIIVDTLINNDFHTFLFVQHQNLNNNILLGSVQYLSPVLKLNKSFYEVSNLIYAMPDIRKITHDLNNKFQIMTGYGSVLEDEISAPDLSDCVTNIMQALADAVNLNRKLRSYFPQKEPSIKPLSTPNKERVEQNETQENHTVLIIDDEPMVQKFLYQMIKRLKHLPTGASTGNEALEKLKNQKYDLAILDMNLPDIDSNELMKQIRQIQPDLKIILISGNERDEQIETLLEEGAIGFIQKPTSVRVLSDTINKVLNS